MPVTWRLGKIELDVLQRAIGAVEEVQVAYRDAWLVHVGAGCARLNAAEAALLILRARS